MLLDVLNQNWEFLGEVLAIGELAYNDTKHCLLLYKQEAIL